MRYAVLGGFLGVVLGAAVLAACGGGSGSDSDGEGAVNPALGIWELVAGGLPVDQGGAALTYFVAQPDGSLAMFGRDGALNLLSRFDGLQGAAGETALLYQTVQSYEARLLKMAADPAGPDTLGLADVEGNAATFERRNAVPENLQPKEFSTVVGRFDDLGLLPSSWTGLVWDGTHLRFTAQDDQVYPVDPSNGVLGSPIAFTTQWEMVHATQVPGADFWSHCRCGNGQEVKRIGVLDVEIDTVDTRDWIGGSPGGMNVNAIAWDDGGSALWLHGFDWEVRRYRFLKVNSDAEPDTLLDSGDFNASISSMTWDGTHLWALLQSGAIARIDPTTFQATTTYLSPDLRVRWYGIAHAPASAGGGNSLYLVGENEATRRGELIELQP